MTKHIAGQEYRKEGRERARLYTVIQCDECGAKTYERKKDKIQAALGRGCRSCHTLKKSQRQSQRKLQSQQDKALVDALKSIHRLLPRPDKRVKHGCYALDYRTANIYYNMVYRCYNPRAFGYEHYGGRGITVCQRWLDNIKHFFDDMGVAPAGYSLERVDVDGSYEPGNCRWIPLSEQPKNRRNCLVNRGIADAKAHWRDYRRKYHHAHYVPTGRPVGRPRKSLG